MKNYLKNHSEHLALVAVIAGLYAGAIAIGTSFAVRILN